MRKWCCSKAATFAIRKTASWGAVFLLIHQCKLPARAQPALSNVGTSFPLLACRSPDLLSAQKETRAARLAKDVRRELIKEHSPFHHKGPPIELASCALSQIRSCNREHANHLVA